MSELKQVPIELIDPNPYRNLATYPWIEPKIEQLMRSIKDVGFWEGLIARPGSVRFEQAFGHHRTEAARRLKLKDVPLILRPLDDLTMLQFMARENSEDYRADFLVLLNTWEGAVQFCESIYSQKSKTIDIATLLGWTHPHGSGRGMQMSAVAAACAAAYELVRDNHLARDDLRGLSASDARELVVVAHKDIADLQKIARHKQLPAKDLALAKTIVARNTQATASQVRAGNIRTKDIRTEVRLRVMHDTRTSRPKLLPLFAAFGRAVIAKIDNMLHEDRAALHITQIEQALPNITLEEDHALVRDLHHSLDQLSKRAELAIRRTTPDKVVKLKAIKGEA